MSCLLVILVFLGIAITKLSEATRHEMKLLSSAVVVGTVYCELCFQQDFYQTSHLIPVYAGASVGVECKYGTSKPSFRKEVRTDEHGEFQVHLPFYVSKHVKRIEGCRVKLINSSEPYCAMASTPTSSSLHLKSRRQGTHVFSAGLFTFRPLNQPILCDQKPNTQNPKKQLFYKKLVSLSPTNYLGFQDPIVPDLPPTNRINYLPPLPRLPELPHLPQLPPLPRLPELPPLPQLPPLLGLPFPPKPGKSTTKTKSAESISDQPELFFTRLLPPNPFKPSPAPSIPFPPIPGFRPTPSPPPQSQPFPFTPFSRAPTSPRIPGIPLGSSSKPASP